MASRNHQQREYLFLRGVEAFRRLTRRPEEFYPCPICGVLFDRDDLTAKLLTLEHVPPESVGGRIMCLTCRRCNNEAGHRIESATAERQRLADAQDAILRRQGRFEGRARISVDGIHLNAAVEAGADGLRLLIHQRRNKPHSYHRAVEGHRRLAASGETGNRLTLSLTFGFSARKVFLGELRTAFLAAFSLFGYRYAFDWRLKPVREQLADPDAAIVPDSACILIPPENRQPEPLIAPLTAPVPALFVFTGFSGVLLPTLSDDGGLYSGLSRIYDDDRRVHISFDHYWSFPKGMVLALDLPN